MSGTINNSGTVSGSITIQTNRPSTGTFTGSYNGSQLNLTITATEIGFPGPGFCTRTLSGTFTHVSGATIYVNPQTTPGTIITTPQILKSQIGAITSDIQTRINDIFRNILLVRQRGGTESLPPGRMPPCREPSEECGKNRDKENEEDKQSSLPVQRTQTGFMMNSLTGMNAGDNSYLMGAWASYSYVDFKNDFAATAFDGQRHGGLAGVDFTPRENVLLGLAAGYEDTDIDTDFNRGNQHTDGFTVAPYFGALLTDNWSLNASAGYSSLNTDQFRTVPVTTTRVTSSPDHDRWFATLNLNGLTTYGKWVLGGQLGFLYALDAEGAFVESDGTQVAGLDSRLGQFNVGGEAAYSLGAYEPFARFSYEYDIKQTTVGVTSGPQPSFDNDDVLLGIGLRYFGTRGLTGNLEFNTRQLREDYDEYSFTATLRYEW